MTSIPHALVWAALIILLALANAAGLVADKDAAVLFAILPAIWIAATDRGCIRKGRAA